MAIIIPANTLAAGGYAVDNSCRFNDGSSDYLSRATVTPTNQDIFTFSVWFKRSSTTTDGVLLGEYADTNNRVEIGFNSDGVFQMYGKTSSTAYVDLYNTSILMRDPAAWSHAVVVYNSSEGTAANRVKIFHNGVQQTAFNSPTYPASNGNSRINTASLTLNIGRRPDGTKYFDGYMSEVVLIDGQALTPTSFGEFDEDSGIWKPIDVSGLTFGNNGFYLDYKDSANLGNDANGGTDWTEVNLAAIDQTTDTPTNNFATLNPLGMPSTNTTFSEGNLTVNVASGSSFFSIPTIGVSSGKWYVEGKLVTANTAGGVYYTDYGFSDRPNSAGELLYASSGRVFWLSNWDSKINYRTGGSTTAGLQTGKTGLSEGDFFQLYLDMDNELMYWGRNGSVTNSTGISFNGKESLTGEYFFAFGDQYTSGTHKYSTNFGQGSIDGSAVSSYNDVNGYGNFKYNPTVSTDEGSKDFLALCTKNLAEYG